MLSKVYEHADGFYVVSYADGHGTREVIGNTFTTRERAESYTQIAEVDDPQVHFVKL